MYVRNIFQCTESLEVIVYSNFPLAEYVTIIIIALMIANGMVALATILCIFEYRNFPLCINGFLVKS